MMKFEDELKELDETIERTERVQKQLEKEIRFWDKIVVVGGAAFLTATLLLVTKCSEAGPYVQVGAHLTTSEWSDAQAAGNAGFPVALEFSGGYAFENGFYIQASHFSNPEAADLGLNLIGGGFRYEW